MMQILAPHFHLAYLRATTRANEDQPSDRQPALTAREEEIMRWVAEGKTNWEISIILHVSLNTIKFHLKNVYQKLGGVENRWAAVAQWQSSAAGLLVPPAPRHQSKVSLTSDRPPPYQAIAHALASRSIERSASAGTCSPHCLKATRHHDSVVAKAVPSRLRELLTDWGGRIVSPMHVDRQIRGRHQKAKLLLDWRAFSGFEIEKFRQSIAMMALISRSAKFRPGQNRGPAPNGTNALYCVPPGFPREIPTNVPARIAAVTQMPPPASRIAG